MINEDISNQISRRLNEIKTSVISQIQNKIPTAITKTVLPSIQNALDMQGWDKFTMADRGLQTGYKRAQGRLISPGWTEGPVGYNGIPNWKILRKYGKNALKRVLRKKTEDECLGRVQ